MKKSLLLLAGIFYAGLFWAVAQICTPDPQYTGDGIYPPCPMDSAYTGQAYSYVITINVPNDTTIPPFGTFNIDSLKLTNINGLPTGLNFQCAPASCTWPGGTSGCVLISGTPSQTGSFPLQASTTVYVTGFGGLPVTYNYCTLIVATPVQVKEYTEGFRIAGNEPDPFSKKTNIRFYYPESKLIDFKVYNLLGKVVYKRKISAEPGMNQFDFYAKDVSSGIYMYSLGTGSIIQTRRMIVARD